MTVKSLKNWIKQGKYFFILCLGIATSTIIGWLWPQLIPTNDLILNISLLTTGTLLQLIGISTSMVITLFNHKSYLARPRFKFIDWVKKIPIGSKKKLKLGLTGSSSRHQINVEGDTEVIKHDSPKDDSLISRIEALEKNLEYAMNHFIGTNRKFKDEIKRLSKKMAENQKKMDAEMNRLEDSFKNMVFGNINWQIIGFYWTIIGIGLMFIHNIM